MYLKKNLIFDYCTDQLINNLVESVLTELLYSAFLYLWLSVFEMVATSPRLCLITVIWLYLICNLSLFHDSGLP